MFDYWQYFWDDFLRGLRGGTVSLFKQLCFLGLTVLSRRSNRGLGIPANLWIGDCEFCDSRSKWELGDHRDTELPLRAV